MLKKWIVLLLTTIFMLAACHSPVYNQTQANIADVKIKASEARKKSDNDARTPPSLVMKQGMYVDTRPISLDREPSWLSSHVVIRGDQLPFSYYSRTIGIGAGNSVLTKYQTGLDPSVNVTLNFTGTVRGALDLLASKSGYVYAIHGKTIYWQSLITRTYDIAFMPGATDYLMGKTSSSSSATSGGGGGGNTTIANYTTADPSDDEYSNLKGTLSIWKDLDNTLKQLLSPDGKVIVSESTTTVTVRDRPTNVELIGRYIENLNRSLSKQVLIKVQILEVQLENDFNFGINWQIIANAFNKSPFVLNGSYGTPISITQMPSFTAQQGLNGGAAPGLPIMGTQVQPNTPNPIPSYTILINALNQQGKTSVVTEPRVVCLNNQVSVIRIVTQNGYLASVQNTSLSSGSSSTNIGIGTVTSQLTPGTIITGLTLYILPKIMKNSIYLQVNADISTNLGFGTQSSGTQGSTNFAQIQLPNITMKHFNQRSKIKSGDTLILSGFRQVGNIAKAQQLYSSQALGGKAAQQQNNETVILITPIILPGSA